MELRAQANDGAASAILRFRSGLVMHQSLCAAAMLGVADLLDAGPQTVAELARKLDVNEDALYRVLRVLAAEDIFREEAGRSFRNNEASALLRGGAPGSLRAMVKYWGSSFVYPCFGELLYSVRTGKPARGMLNGLNSFEHLRRDPEMARLFDDAMTAMSQLLAPAVASAYDFGAWGSLMDVGGGNGILLSHILRAHSGLRGVLADQAHVIGRARERGFLDSGLSGRVSMEECDFFEEIPAGCRAYMMSRVIHDWNDEQAVQILVNCRKVVPDDGALLLVEGMLREDREPGNAKVTDVIMLVMTGGRERTEEEYRALLRSAGFRLEKVVPAGPEMVVMEARPQ